MSEKKNNSVGLYIGKDYLLAVELSFEKRYKIENIAEVYFSPEYIKGGLIIAKDEFKEVLNKFFNTHGLSKENIYISIPDDAVVIRLQKIPFMTTKEIKEYVKGEAEQYAVFRGKEIAVDFSVQEEIQEQGAKQLLLLLTAGDKKLFSMYYEIFQSLDLQIEQIEPLSFSLARCYGKEIQNKNILLISIFDKISNLFVIKQNYVLFSRSIDIGYENIPNENVNLPVSEETVRGLGDFIAEIQHSLGFYRMQFPEDEISKCILYFDVEKYIGLDKYLQNIIKCSMEVANPLLSENEIQRGEFQDGYINRLSSNLAVAVGCAKYHFEKNNYKFNISLLSVKRKIKFDKKFLLAASIIPVLLISSAIYASVLQKKIEFTEKEILGISQRIQEIEQRSSSMRAEELKQKIDVLKKEIEMEKKNPAPRIPQQDNLQYDISSFLKDIRYYIPSDVWISSCNSDGRSFTISGFSLTQDGVSKFLSALHSFGSFSNVSLEYSEEFNYEGKNIIKYKINCIGKNI